METQLKAYVEKNVDEDVLQVAVASDDTIDRHGDSLDVDKWDLSNFKKNPVLVDLHIAERSSTSVVGKVEKIWFENNKMKFQPRFASKENPKAKIIRDLYKGGFLNAFSVGFLKKEDKYELLEISTVPVPANPSAIVEIRSKGLKPTDWEGRELSFDKGKTVRLMDLQLKHESDILEKKKSLLRQLRGNK